jgi:hypothetical protein
MAKRSLKHVEDPDKVLAAFLDKMNAELKALKEIDSHLKENDKGITQMKKSKK